jgi:MFS transporter, ACS family, hexuronate transporter
MGSLTRGSWPWLMCVVLLTATLLNYMDRQALAVTLKTFKNNFNIAEARIGIIEGCFGYAFAVGSLFFGFIADRFGPRYLYPLVLTGWSLAGIATALAGEPTITSYLERPHDDPGAGVFRWLVFCRILLGFFEAGHWPCALLTVRAILDSKNRTLGNGILQSGASLGAIIVPLYVEAVERAGMTWRFPFLSIGIVGLVWVPLWFSLVRGRELRVDSASSSETDSAHEYENLTQKLFVLAAVVATLTISWQFLRAWLALYLEDHLQYTRLQSRTLMSVYFIAADVGCILSGVLVHALITRGFTSHSARLTGYLLFVLLTACGAIVPFSGGGWLLVVLLCLTGAGILGLHPFYYSLTQELPRKHIGKLSGALAAFGWIVSSASQIWIGKQIQDSKSYTTGLLMVGLAPVIGLLTLAFFWPRTMTTPSVDRKTDYHLRDR